MPVQLNLAPAGYSLDFFKDNGRIVRMGDGADPERGLTVRLPFPGEAAPIEGLPDVVDGTARPVEEVTVQGRPAQLVRTDYSGNGPQGAGRSSRRRADGPDTPLAAPYAPGRSPSPPPTFCRTRPAPSPAQSRPVDGGRAAPGSDPEGA